MKKVFRILLIIFLIFIGILVYPIISYLLWQKQFQSQIPNMSCVSNLTELLPLDEKFKGFVMSEDQNTFIELSTNETLSLLQSTDIISGGEVTNICIAPNSAVWSIYAKLSLQGINIPWVRLDIAKDTMETAQLYVSNIFVGNILVPEKITENIKTQLNKGISDALVLVNENNFLGRKIQNIELLNDKIVVKGTL
ncbi:MAG: hypothetical protein UR96_C0012G0002 [candidate division WS6 bacterium GW2011_GWC1_36_11]|uniref:Uncharacterized protein n=3 Tax=Candidatus Dojkabacteria TaxID=74243 RepID=A0A0G0FYR6_9BACT|nr:MAG: hypothetical protein UR96_C0012G0002 [candidate division WS6 bacterium GW2011_GWC1_36_11]KKQ10902.1 MAG: hypothetical protein US23_C0018G0004 [candidate division WS6 bacterium GW2011_GWE1_36_69]KKQ11648.1 MAG: hypothetical protein US24_C0020G0004 [candidate division WS6 bacterium GW2011_GWC2_36_7]KKQ15125.1 MAG: hypothetical protein US29_C0051G0004 [candidate division WS6 bacterium GW2011_GWF1_36_8]HAM37179.1 hypothetical protein [Patescibacteria group bacterium]